MVDTKFAEDDIVKAWKRYAPNKSAAARSLGMNRAGFVQRLGKMGVGVVRRYVITNAWNNIGLFYPFWHSLQVYCREVDASLIVAMSRYKNPSAMTMGDPVWYPAEIFPFGETDRRSLNSMITLHADVPIQPTAEQPLSALDSHAGGRWAIFGHPQLAMRVVPSTMDSKPPVLYTTGSVSLQEGYSESKTGKKAELNHTYGALVVECVDDVAHVRQLVSNDKGEFCDLNRKYTPRGSEAYHSVLAVVTGDEHIAVSDRTVMDVTYHNPDSIIKTLRPLEIIRPDVLDFFSRNHHHTDPLQNFVKHLQGTDDVRKEIEDTLRFIEDTTPDGSVSQIVAANHNEALDRFLREADPKRDPRNARFYHEMQALLHQIAEDTGEYRINAFEAYAKEHFKINEDKVRFLSRNKSHLIGPGEIDVSQHGDRGANGGRGSRAAYARASHKSIIQHSHSPGIDKGCWQVGTSTGALDYVSGLSSWMNTHAVIYPTGKRSFIHIIDGRWKA